MKSQIGFTKDKLVYCEVWPEPRYLEDGFRLDKEPTYLQAIASALEKGIPFEDQKELSIRCRYLGTKRIYDAWQPKEGDNWNCPDGVEIIKCSTCNGHGQLSRPPFDDSGECPFCKGKGRVAILPMSIYSLKSPRTNVLSFTKNTSMIKCGDILYNKLGNPLHLIAYSDQFDNGKITVLPMFDEKAVPIDMDINNLEVVETFEFLTWPNNEVKEVMRQKQNLILFLDNLRKY